MLRFVCILFENYLVVLNFNCIFASEFKNIVKQLKFKSYESK